MIWVLLVVYQLKHFLADFPLQTPYMLGKFRDRGWIKPLLAHVGVHGGFTFAIALYFTHRLDMAWGLMLFDATVHFIMDRLKAGRMFLGRYKALSAIEFTDVREDLESKDKLRRFVAKQHLRGNTLFWWALGLDQGVHHLTHYTCIFAILRHLP